MSIFLFAPENFFLTVNSRIDSPSYVIRNQFRNFIAEWSEADPKIKHIISLKLAGSDLYDFPEKALLTKYENMEFLSEQLKIKDRKLFYSKFGETAFLGCKYCSSDFDYLFYLSFSVLFEYVLFLGLVGILTTEPLKSNWRPYGLLISFISIFFEIYSHLLQDHTGFEIYSIIFSEDFFTLRYEKITFIRQMLFISFLLVVLLFDNGKDFRLQTILSKIQKSLETSVALLQSSRIQEAATSVDETLLKFVLEAKKRGKTSLASIVADPLFRQKVADSGTSLEFEKLLKQNNDSLEALFEIASSK